MTKFLAKSFSIASGVGPGPERREVLRCLICDEIWYADEGADCPKVRYERRCGICGVFFSGHKHQTLCAVCLCSSEER